MTPYRAPKFAELPSSPSWRRRLAATLLPGSPNLCHGRWARGGHWERVVCSGPDTHQAIGPCPPHGAYSDDWTCVPQCTVGESGKTCTLCEDHGPVTPLRRRRLALPALAVLGAGLLGWGLWGAWVYREVLSNALAHVVTGVLIVGGIGAVARALARASGLE